MPREVVDAIVPALADLGEPRRGFLKALWDHAIADLAAEAFRRQQPGAGQGAQVLDDRLAGHRVVARQLAGALRPGRRQLVQEAPAGGIG
jgi:hypothetical protein